MSPENRFSQLQRDRENQKKAEAEAKQRRQEEALRQEEAKKQAAQDNQRRQKIFDECTPPYAAMAVEALDDLGQVLYPPKKILLVWNRKDYAIDGRMPGYVPLNRLGRSPIFENERLRARWPLRLTNCVKLRPRHYNPDGEVTIQLVLTMANDGRTPSASFKVGRLLLLDQYDNSQHRWKFMGWRVPATPGDLTEALRLTASFTERKYPAYEPSRFSGPVEKFDSELLYRFHRFKGRICVEGYSNPPRETFQQPWAGWD